MKDKKEFGLFIQKKRKEKGYSQKDLAEILYIGESAVSKWERGVSYPDISMISDIAKTLDVTEAELINASCDIEYRKMKKESISYKIISKTWFLIPTVCYITALLICFICNLAINHKLSWFFVVGASLLCAFTFVPTVTRFFKSQKLNAFLISSLLSIVILFITCGIYTKSFNWVGIASFSVLLGYIILFLPVILSVYNVFPIIKKYKWLICFLTDGLFLYLLLLIINITKNISLGKSALTIIYSFIPIIALGFIVSIRSIDAYLKTGISVIIFGITYYFIDSILGKIWGYKGNSLKINFSDWEKCLNGNIMIISFAFCIFSGIIFISISILKHFKNKNSIHRQN